MDSLEPLIRFLQQEQQRFTEDSLGPIEVADMLWLATQLYQSQFSEVTADQQELIDIQQDETQLQLEPIEDTPQKLKVDGDPREQSQEPIEEEQEEEITEVSVTPPPAQSPEPGMSLPFQVPAARAIPQRRQISRALKCLQHKVPSRIEQQLDVAATIKRISEEQLCVPVYKPKTRRWLEVALVVEKSASFGIWEQTIKEFRQILNRQGAFRSVTCWYAESDEQHGLRLTSLQGNVHHPKEVIGADSDRLILVLSDCISTAWYQHESLNEGNDSVSLTSKSNWFNWISIWQRSHPVTLIQMLPHSFWRRTALKEVDSIWMSSHRPKPLNHQWELESTTPWDDEKISGFPIPVVTLDPYALNVWAKGIAGASPVQLSGIAFEAIKKNEGTGKGDFDAYESFLKFGSPGAKRLAALISAVPVQLPIIRLVQKNVMKNESTAVHVAELFFSGILKMSRDDTDPEKCLYDFREDYREQLNQTIPEFELATVIDALSLDIMRRSGFDSLEKFRACLVASQPEGADAISTEISEFARVSLDVLRRLGGEYEEFVNNLGPQPPPSPSEIVFEDFTFEPPKIAFQDGPQIETQFVSVATITFEDQLLETFAFNVATLLQTESENFFGRMTRNILGQSDSPNREWKIQTIQKQAKRYIEWLGNEVGLEMVSIPGGTFEMGASGETREQPIHEVTVPTFFMGRYPITQKQWSAVAEKLPAVEIDLDVNPSRFKGDNLPVEQVNWFEAVEFCQRLSRAHDKDYRLPSEAEWEYACRAGTTSPFHFGEMITTEVANYNGQPYKQGPEGKKRGKTSPVDQFNLANAFGLCEMHGNVWEWCQDVWHSNYKNAPTDGSAWLEAGDDAFRVRRGGSWYNGPGHCRSAYRYFNGPAYRYGYYGFRVVSVSRGTP